MEGAMKLTQTERMGPQRQTHAPSARADAARHAPILLLAAG